MKTYTNLRLGAAVSASILVLGHGSVGAQGINNATDTAETSKSRRQPVLEEVIVRGSVVRTLDLMSTSQTGSRLGLSAFETPATVDVIGSDTMRARGLLSVTEAAESLVGVNSGENPGAPSAFSMRGFTDSQITSLRDGLRIGPASMVTRPQNTFNLERVEILKGPSSVLYGEGAIAGTVNSVTKKPKLGQDTSHEFLGTFGRFGTYQLGGGTGGSFSDDVAYRFDASKTGSDGWVDDTPAESTNVTASVITALSDALEVSFMADYLNDELPNNWGQPLVPESFATRPIRGVIAAADGRVIDSRMRFTNYNVKDNVSKSEQVLLHANLNWMLSDTVTLHDQVYYFTASRDWLNAEQYVFDEASGLVTRDRFFVLHDQEIYGNKLDLKINSDFGGRENTFLVGMDYSEIDFERGRGFPDGDAVDLLNPDRGFFGETEDKLSSAEIKTSAFYFEDSFDLTPELKLVTGGRYEIIDLVREDYGFDGEFDPFGSSFEQDFKAFSWRAGAVYNLTSELVVYGQYSTGKDPVGTELFSVESSESFDLASSRQWEIGLKASLDGDTEVTLAYFDILREDLLTQISQDEVANVGSQGSRGLEFATSMSFTEDWKGSFNFAYVDAEYHDFFDPIFEIDASDNRPPNVGKWTANAWTSIDNIAGFPIEIGGGVRYIDDRFADVANTLALKSYVLVNAFAAYTSGGVRYLVRAKNLTDEEYVPWVSPFYTDQVALGSPRAFEVSIEAKF